MKFFGFPHFLVMEISPSASLVSSREFLTKKLQYFQGQGAWVYGAKAHDRIANQCVYTFAVCLGNHTQLVLRDSDDLSAPRSSLTLLERSFLNSGRCDFRME